MKILFDNIVTKAVYRAYFCKGQHYKLMFEVLVIGIFTQFVADCLRNSFSHLLCCGTGKGYDKKPVRRTRIFSVRQSADNTLNKNGSLT